MRYDYECQSCGHVQEEMHPMAGPDEEICCEECGSKDMCKCPPTGTQIRMAKPNHIKKNYNR